MPVATERHKTDPRLQPTVCLPLRVCRPRVQDLVLAIRQPCIHVGAEVVSDPLAPHLPSMGTSEHRVTAPHRLSSSPQQSIFSRSMHISRSQPTPMTLSAARAARAGGRAGLGPRHTNPTPTPTPTCTNPTCSPRVSPGRPTPPHAPTNQPNPSQPLVSFDAHHMVRRQHLGRPLRGMRGVPAPGQVHEQVRRTRGH